MSRFSRSGISFDYPNDWLCEIEGDDFEWTTSFQSNHTAFIILTLISEESLPHEIVDQSLETLKQDYPDLVAEATVESIANQVAYGYDIDFFSSDIPILCWTRSFQLQNGSLFLLAQAAENEEETIQIAFNMIRSSLIIDDE